MRRAGRSIRHELSGDPAQRDGFAVRDGAGDGGATARAGGRQVMVTVPEAREMLYAASGVNLTMNDLPDRAVAGIVNVMFAEVEPAGIVT
jgi:hypothetical protein